MTEIGKGAQNRTNTERCKVINRCYEIADGGIYNKGKEKRRK